jgi:hypothetical protein
MGGRQVGSVLARFEQRPVIVRLLRLEMAGRTKAVALFGHGHRRRWEQNQGHQNHHRSDAPQPTSLAAFYPISHSAFVSRHLEFAIRRSTLVV